MQKAEKIVPVQKRRRDFGKHEKQGDFAMLIKNAKVLIGKAFLDADIQFDRTITAVGKLDGPADLDAAGGYVDGGVMAALEAQGAELRAVLQENDAYHALARCGGLIKTGPTGTNVNDLSVLLIKR